MQYKKLNDCYKNPSYEKKLVYKVFERLVSKIQMNKANIVHHGITAFNSQTFTYVIESKAHKYRFTKDYCYVDSRKIGTWLYLSDNVLVFCGTTYFDFYRTLYV